MEMCAGSGTIRKRLRHEARDQSHPVRDLGCRQLEEDETVGGGQRIEVVTGALHQNEHVEDANEASIDEVEQRRHQRAVHLGARPLEEQPVDRSRVFQVAHAIHS